MGQQNTMWREERSEGYGRRQVDDAIDGNIGAAQRRLDGGCRRRERQATMAVNGCSRTRVDVLRKGEELSTMGE